jgi:hypothetical protein
MSIIPVSVTEAQFREFTEPSLSQAKRGYVCRTALFKVFNYILYKLHTGCQGSRLPIAGLVDSEVVERKSETAALPASLSS